MCTAGVQRAGSERGDLPFQMNGHLADLGTRRALDPELLGQPAVPRAGWALRAASGSKGNQDWEEVLRRTAHAFRPNRHDQPERPPARLCLSPCELHRMPGQAAPLRPLPERTTTEINKVRRRDRLGGLLHEYQQAA